MANTRSMGSITRTLIQGEALLPHVCQTRRVAGDEALRLAGVIKDADGAREIAWAMIPLARTLNRAETESVLLTGLIHTADSAGDRAAQARARNEAGLKEALKKIPQIREEFWKNLTVTGQVEGINQSLEYAGRVADFMEFAELLCLDALHRNESCGGHFRVEYQDEGECRRDDANFAYVAAWEYQGPDKPHVLHKEPLTYEEVHMSTRSYK